MKQDLRQSAEYRRYISNLGWKVVRIQRLEPGVQIFIRPLGIFGAIAKIQRVNLPLPWDEIRPLLKKHRVWMTKVEPLVPGSQLGRWGFKRDDWPMLATKTVRVDLRPPLKKTVAGFKKDARYCLRKSAADNPQFKINDFEGFYRLWIKAARAKRLWVPPKKDFEALARSFGNKVFCVTVDGLAGAVILMHDKTAYYYYAAALPEGKHRLLPYSVVWKSMQEAKKRGCTTWDFEGVYDPRWPNKSTLGYSHFKRSFGGKEVDFPGSFTRWF